MMRKINETGRRFGRLDVLADAGRNKSGRVMWRCLCSCGRKIVVEGNNLRNGNTSSCGCLQREEAAERVRKHDLRQHPLYNTWSKMKDRCYNPGSNRYSRYGARGIYICETWKNDARSFIEWAEANGWKKGLQIDRIDNDGPYQPANCRFVTNRANCSNTSIQKRKDLPVGVHPNKNGTRYVSWARLNGKNTYLGMYDTVEETKAVYLKAILEVDCSA